MNNFTKILIVLILSIPFNVFAQIPNGGFESWFDETTPEDWLPNNVPTLWTTVTRTNTAQQGSFAAKLSTVDFGGSPMFPFLQSNPFPVNQAYGSLSGYYQFQQASGTEVLYIIAWFLENSNFVGYGAIDIGTPASSYTQFSFNIDYTRDAAVVPDSAYIQIGVVDTSENEPVIGSSALIDNLTFGGPASVKEIDSEVPENFELSQNYPNPFNPSTKINFNIPEQSYVDLTVYDILGNEITRLVSDNYPAGKYSVEFNADNLPAGVYLARISAGSFSNTIKMILLK